MNRRRQRFTQVDAFTDQPFAGNPAAVCLLPSPADPIWMQHVAREMNLAETAFLVRRDDGFDLRWFTPTVEVDLCGHATLASAHALWEEEHLDPGAEARFHTRSGVLSASREGDLIWLDFPATPDHPCPSRSCFRSRRRRPPRRTHPVRLPGGAGVRVDGTLARTRSGGAGPPRHPWRNRHRPFGRPEIPLCLPFLCARCRHRGRPGYRLGPLCAGAVLGCPARKNGDGRLSGVGARRHGAGSSPGRPGAPGRARRDRVTRRAAALT